MASDEKGDLQQSVASTPRCRLVVLQNPVLQPLHAQHGRVTLMWTCTLFDTPEEACKVALVLQE